MAQAIRIACLSTMAMFVVSTASAVPIVQNGSFENWSATQFFNGGPGLAEFAQVPGWSTPTGRVDIFFSPGYNASEGLSSLRVHPDPVPTEPNSNLVFQDISGFEVGNSYRLTFDAAIVNSLAYGVWSVPSKSPDLVVSVGSKTWAIDPLPVTNPASFNSSFPFSYASQSLTFAATASTLRVQFKTILGPTAAGIAVDNVAVSAVPEPSAAWMLIVGSALILPLQRFRRKSAIRQKFAASSGA